MHDIIGLVEFLIGAVVVLAVVFVVLLVVVSRLPEDNPLRQVLHLLMTRVGATAGAGLLAIPIEPIPGLDAVYDIAAPAFLVYYWYTFFRNALRIGWRVPRQRPPRIGDDLPPGGQHFR
jgi:hypothetical protein